MTDDNLAPESTADMTTKHTARIGLIADLHWTPDDADELRHALHDAIEHFEVADVDHIISLGDLIMEADSTFETRDRFTTVTEIITDLTDIPFTTLYGNHDVINGDGKPIKHDLPGDGCGTIDLADDITGMYVDTSSPQWADARGALGEEQLDFLETQLDRHTNAVIFSHHALYNPDISDDNWFADHPECAVAHDKYLTEELVADHDVLATVNAHNHIEHTTTDIVPRITVNSMNEEQPTNQAVNGSFAVLDVSPTSVEYISHRHGEFDSSTTFDHPLGRKVALGGTFGPLHDGHQKMFERAFELGDVYVGLTSDELAQKTRHESRPIPTFEERKNALDEMLSGIAETFDRTFTIEALNDPWGPVATDPAFTHLIVSPETFSRGEELNTKRFENDLQPIELEVVEPKLADDGTRISSTRIVNDEIDRHGNLLD